MKIKFNLQRSGGEPIALMATVDAAATVGDLARHLVRIDPGLAGGGTPDPARVPTLSLSSSSVALSPEARISDAGLRSGASVRITYAPSAYETRLDAPITATVLVTAGRDRGSSFEIRGSTAVIGRDHGCAVRLTDSMVSRQHARLTFGRDARVVDLGSVNGTEVNNVLVSRAALRPGDVIRVGDTEMSIRLKGNSAAGSHGGADGFIRSPRLDPRYEGQTFQAPEPPEKPAPQRPPLIALIGPIAMGVVLWFVTHQWASLLFVALSPLMMLGYSIESTMSAKSAFRKAVERFEVDLSTVETDVYAALTVEQSARNAEHPSLGACLQAAREASPLLWTRRPDDPGFLEVRLGLGSAPTRNVIDLPKGRNFPRDLAAKLSETAAKYATVSGVPVVAYPAEHGAIGVGGERTAVLGVARGLIAQIVTLHSPAEVILAAFASEESARDWEWLTWLPHVTSGHSPLAAGHLASSVETAAALISGLEDLLDQRRKKEAGPLPAVVVLVEDDAAVERTRSRLVELAEQGYTHGIHVIWVASSESKLPAACRTFVVVNSPAAGMVAVVPERGMPVHVALEGLGEADARNLSLRLAPLVDVGARLDDDSDLPRAVPLVHVAENPLVASWAAILERWAQNGSIRTATRGYAEPGRPRKKDGGLGAVLGRTAEGPHRIDLRADGPHALVGGTTGAGKSELLQSWILALAAGYSPDRLTFLFVDYKGGSAFKELKDLPHKVGFVTDLDPHEVQRAMVSLSAELRARERLFRTYGVKDLVELEKRRDATDVPPSLVIVVDEFAALVAELPDFVDGMINIAQRGRSLGVHLILATQQPSGVIKGNLRANTNLRIALRTADESDSTDVLGSPHAAFFDPQVPGRAVSKTGPGRLVTFQAGYAGGWTRDEPDPPEIVVEELRFGARKVWEPPEQAEEVPVDPGLTDAQRLVAAMAEAHREAGLRRPEQPWKDPLSPAYEIFDFTTLPNEQRDDVLVFGMQDQPDLQQQLPVAYRPDSGNLAVYGTGGTGKTTLLRTLAVSAGLALRGGPCHVYALDFGGRGLDALAELPHVGAVINGTDSDRVSRLITRLGDLIRERAVKFAETGGASTIAQYRSAPGGDPGLPRILLLVDGLGAFRQAYESADRAKLFDLFGTIAAEGRPVGVHVVLTADRPAALPSALASTMPNRIVLRMAEPGDYFGLSVPGDVLGPASPPGRGLLGDVEIQVAIRGTYKDENGQVRALDGRGQGDALHAMAQAMRDAGVRPAEEVKGMPERVDLETLEPSASGDPVLGLAVASLRGQPFRPDGTFLITGPPMSGRTAAMRAMGYAVRRWRADAQLHLLTPHRRSPLARLPIWSSTAAGPDEISRRVKELADEFRLGLSHQVGAVFLENIVDLAGLGIEDLVRVCLSEGVLVVGDGDPHAVTSNSGLLGVMKESRTGIALTPEIGDLIGAFRLNYVGRLHRADFPPGRGLHVLPSGHTVAVQVGWVEER